MRDRARSDAEVGGRSGDFLEDRGSPGRILTADLACQVVPDLPTFAVDDGFTYAIPTGTDVSVGSRVRVRVSGRRLKGCVTSVMDRPEHRSILDVEGLVGDFPSFGAQDLPLLRWCATHYVAPMSVILRRTLPPNVPKGVQRAEQTPAASQGVGFQIIQVIQRPPYEDAISELVGSADSRGTIVVAPTVVEVEAIAQRLMSTFGDRVVIAHSSLSGSDATRAWVRGASEEGVCIVGTREVALWPVRDLGAIGVVEDARRVMRSPSTPTLGVREVMVERARHAGVPITFVGSLPSLEVLARRPTVSIAPGRRWPLVEVADRREEPPTTSPVLDRTRAAIAHAAREDEPAFILVSRRGHAGTIYCASCGELRRCTICGAAASTTEVCARCDAPLSACISCGADRWRSVGAGRGNVIEDLHRVVGDRVGDKESARLITVGTERDLVGVTGMALAVAIDVDGMAFAPNYRAGEDTLRLLIRLAMTLQPGRGRRALLQTADPQQPVIEALRTGDPGSFLSNELAARNRSGFPPFGELIALEVSDSETATALIDRDIGALATVRGPATVGDRERWLIHGDDLGRARVALRPVARTLRDRGAKVRIDVDPIDL